MSESWGESIVKWAVMHEDRHGVFFGVWVPILAVFAAWALWLPWWLLDGGERFPESFDERVKGGAP